MITFDKLWRKLTLFNLQNAWQIFNSRRGNCQQQLNEGKCIVLVE